MSAAMITALCTGIPTVLAAIGLLIGQIRHANNPAAHDPAPPRS